jgi:hypothetical protein
MRTPHEIDDEEYAAKVARRRGRRAGLPHPAGRARPALRRAGTPLRAGQLRACSTPSATPRPRLVLFGHVHQPLQAAAMRTATECVNVGHFRAPDVRRSWTCTPLTSRADRRTCEGRGPMADQASSTITIDAPAERVLAVISDIGSYPQWTGRSRAPRCSRAAPTAARSRRGSSWTPGVLKDEYVLEYDWNARASTGTSSARARCRSRRSAPTRSPTGRQTEVTYKLAVDISMPMMGMFKRKAEKMIMDSALKELKKRVESQA